METKLRTGKRLRTLGASLLLVVGAVAAYLLLVRVGDRLPGPPAGSGDPALRVEGQGAGLASVLLALAVITLAARLCGGLFRRLLGQPSVMGEIFAGLALGPSLLGAIAPAAHEFLLPASVTPTLSVVSTVGIVMFMFLVGLELDPRLLRGRTQATIGISSASIVVPFLLGAALALHLYPLHAGGGVSFTEFSLLIGVSMSVTAFPVLARILRDRGAQHTPLGATALACAAANDVTAWTLLALVAGVATAQPEGVAWTIGFTALYVAAMLLVARPLLRPLIEREQRKPGTLGHTALATVFVGLLLSAFTTELIGIHGLFGAFLFGVILPHDGRFAEQVRARIEDFVTVVFLPVFFAFTGLRTQVGLLDGAQDWLLAGLILCVATAGKFGGTLAAARLCGMGWRPAAALGVLMNTRGLMEMIVLNLGLDMGLITPELFTMLVLMTLVTTFATPPLLGWVLGRGGFAGADPAAIDPQGADAAVAKLAGTEPARTQAARRLPG
jgi:Kef-type K+ transport system membrane component KefB